MVRPDRPFAAYPCQVRSPAPEAGSPIRRAMFPHRVARLDQLRGTLVAACPGKGSCWSEAHCFRTLTGCPVGHSLRCEGLTFVPGATVALSLRLPLVTPCTNVYCSLLHSLLKPYLTLAVAIFSASCCVRCCDGLPHRCASLVLAGRQPMAAGGAPAIPAGMLPSTAVVINSDVHVGDQLTIHQFSYDTGGFTLLLKKAFDVGGPTHLVARVQSAYAYVDEVAPVAAGNDDNDNDDAAPAGAAPTDGKVGTDNADTAPAGAAPAPTDGEVGTDNDDDAPACAAPAPTDGEVGTDNDDDAAAMGQTPAAVGNRLTVISVTHVDGTLKMVLRLESDDAEPIIMTTHVEVAYIEGADDRALWRSSTPRM